MSALIYYLALPFIYLLSLLPFRLLYFLSDGFYLMIYYIIGYRKEVVLENLRSSFPEKTKDEINAICKEFFRYFCDLFLETFKTLTIRRSEMLKHCFFDQEAETLFNQLAEDHKSIIIVMGHFGNWEWAGNAFSLSCKHQLYVIYHPLGNKYFNGLIYKMRTRFGTKLVDMKNVFPHMLRSRNELNATAFIADQTPLPDKAYWMNFLNQDTPVYLGTEKIALKMQYPIVYATVKKIKRGYYSVKSSILFMPPLPNKEGEITQSQVRQLEKDILEQPEIWLWTHRRWKHKRIG